MENNKYLVPLAIVVAGVLVAAAVFFGGKGPVSGSLTGKVDTNATNQPKAVDAANVKINGEPYIGNGNAPVTMVYWYDYQCPFCKINEEQTMVQLINEYVNTGKLKIVFKDYQFLGADSQTLGLYSRAVWEVNPSKFYAWHKTIFDNQGQENSGWATQDKILTLTKSVLTETETDQVVNLVQTKKDEFQKDMDADRSEGSSLGINGTPGTIIGKQLIDGARPYSFFKSAIEAELSKK